MSKVNANVKNTGSSVTVESGQQPTIQLDKVGARDAFWYRTHEGELADVTTESSNPALGIINITVSPASDKQRQYMIVANVRLETILGTFSGIQVKESEHTPGSLYISTNSRNIAKEGEAARWISDIKLSRPGQAQVLAYIDTLIKPNKK